MIVGIDLAVPSPASVLRDGAGRVRIHNLLASARDQPATMKRTLALP
jgi:hypothetical protein